jgi:hypothetical protein
MKLTHRGSLICALLAWVTLWVLMAVAIIEPRAARAILALMAVSSTFFILKVIVAGWEKAGWVIDGSRRMMVEMREDRQASQHYMH